MKNSVGGSPYIIVCFLIRFVMGIGASMVWSTGVLIMVSLVPDYSERITSWTESCIGLGIAFGPPIGSFLYTFGGFLTPFLSLGIFQTLLTIVCIIYIPNPIKIENQRKPYSECEQEKNIRKRSRSELFLLHNQTLRSMCKHSFIHTINELRFFRRGGWPLS